MKEINDLKKKSEDEREENYTSLIDEFRRQKIIYGSKKIKSSSIDNVWDALEKTIAKTFKIKRKLEKDIEFGMKIKGIYTKYLLKEHNKDEFEISIFWLNANDKYWLHYKIVPTIYKNVFKVKFKEVVFREQTFFGLSDSVGLVLLKISFRKNIKMLINSMKSIINDKNIENLEN